VHKVWIPGEAKTFESKCRSEMNNGARKISGSDGTAIDFTMTIYMPKTTIDIPVNANYVLNGKISGIVKGAKNFQLGSVIWV
jgi:hypothetical protein